MPGAVAAGGPSAPLWSRSVLAFNCGLVVSYLALWAGMAAEGDFVRADFRAFYLGWSMVLDGQSDRLYDLDLQADYQKRAVPELGDREGLLAFVNPPHAALPLAPLALLPFPAAFYAWTLFQVGLLFLLGCRLRELAAGWGPRAAALLLVTVAAFPPLLMTFQLGQVSLLAAVCLLGFYRGLKRGRPFPAAFWLVLCTFKPQLVVVPAAVLLAGRRWRELGLASLLFGAWVAAAGAVMGWRCWPGFVGMTAHVAGQFGGFVDPLKMYNVKGFLAALLGPGRAGLVNLASGATFLGAVLAALWLWRGPWRPDAPDFDLRLALTLQLGLVCNPHFNPADALTLVLPAVLFASYLHQQGLPVTRFVALAACCPLLFLIDSFAVASWPGGIRPFFLLELGALVWMARALARRSTFRAPSDPVATADGAAVTNS